MDSIIPAGTAAGIEMSLARTNFNGGASGTAIDAATEANRPSVAHFEGSLLLTPQQAYERLGGVISVATLAAWRMTGAGPKFLKLGRRVAYREADIVEWLNARAVSTTAEADAKGFGTC